MTDDLGSDGVSLERGLGNFVLGLVELRSRDTFVSCQARIAGLMLLFATAELCVGESYIRIFGGLGMEAIPGM